MRTTSVRTPKVALSIIQLEQVFATFNKVSSDLGESYKELEGKVAILNQELAVTHSERLRELTEKELLAAKLSTLMAALPGGVITLDNKGNIKEENPAAFSILGKSYQGYEWGFLLNELGANEITFNGEVSLFNDKRISISNSMFGDKGEKIILLTDVSENYRLNNLANRDKRLKALGEMAARLAHQIRTPLTSAILYISHLASLENKATKSNGIIQKLLARLCQIEKLIDGMLSYLRGGINNYESFCLNDLIEEVQTALELQVCNASGKLNIFIPNQKLIISGNKETLFNALSNLVDNALQAIPRGAEISIKLYHEDNSYIIHISDNGPGIADSLKEQVFDPFFSTRSTGTGLGLAVVLSAVKAHSGEVVISDNPKGGTIFKISIPDGSNLPIQSTSLWNADIQNLLVNEQDTVNG